MATRSHLLCSVNSVQECCGDVWPCKIPVLKTRKKAATSTMIFFFFNFLFLSGNCTKPSFCKQQEKAQCQSCWKFMVRTVTRGGGDSTPICIVSVLEDRHESLLGQYCRQYSLPHWDSAMLHQYFNIQWDQQESCWLHSLVNWITQLEWKRLRHWILAFQILTGAVPAEDPKYWLQHSPDNA